MSLWTWYRFDEPKSWTKDVLRLRKGPFPLLADELDPFIEDAILLRHGDTCFVYNWFGYRLKAIIDMSDVLKEYDRQWKSKDWKGGFVIAKRAVLRRIRQAKRK